MDRRTFIAATGGTLASALAARAGATEADNPTVRSLEARLSRWVQAYDSQGNHRTGTEGDAAAAQWLGAELSRMGVPGSTEAYEFNRVDPIAAYVKIADRRIDGVPAFDAAFTGAEGIRGRLGPLGSDAEIALAETRPFVLLEPRGEQRGQVAQARQSSHKAVLLVTQGGRPGLFLLNALAFDKPASMPILQVSSADADWLKQQAEARAPTTLVAQVARAMTRTHNVVAAIAGSQPGLAPIVVSTPFSGWWQCAGERGGGIACWLETVRAVAGSRPVRPCLFVALNGHELGNLGLLDYLKRRDGILKQAHRWIHFGANIGVPHQPNLVHSADAEIERWAAANLKLWGLPMNAAPHGDLPRGEGLLLHRGGARYVTLTCGTTLFHNAADRWPEEVDVEALARYALAFSGAIRDLASA